MRTTQKTNTRHGFTLIEMVGVLAVIAILAALLIPKIFAAINESRINNTVASYNTVKSASMTYFGKYGKFGDVAGKNLPATGTTNWGSVLLTEGLVEKAFAPKMGDGATIYCIPPGTSGETDFALDGVATNALVTASGSFCIACVISNVPPGDAYELSRRIDGESLTAADATVLTDAKGAVKYDLTGSDKNVYIYVGHK